MTTQVSYVKTHQIAGDHVTIDLPSRAAELRALLPGHGRRSETVYKEAGLTLVLIALEPNDTIPPHAAGGSTTVHVLEGAVTLTAGGASADLGAGQIAAFGPGVTHDVHAHEESLLLLTVAAIAEDRRSEDTIPPRGPSEA